MVKLPMTATLAYQEPSVLLNNPYQFRNFHAANSTPCPRKRLIEIGRSLTPPPTVMDRVIQQAIAQVLTPIFDPTFSELSFAFRPGRNAHQALRQVQATVKDGRNIAVDIDLAKFFDTVSHDVLMNLLRLIIADKRLLRLIGRYLRAGVLVGEHLEPSEVDTPQGGPLSPLLANILLHQLDLELERRGHRFARYADDLIILVKSQRAAQRVMQTALKLKVNCQKQGGSDERMRLSGLHDQGQENTLD